MGKTTENSKTAPTYAALQSELDQVMATLQHDGVDVDDALVAYKRGTELIAELEAYLKNAENTIKKISIDLSKPVA